MYYDSLNRLTGKFYTTDVTTCPGSPTMNATYTYDSTSGGNKGKGHRTGTSNTSNGVTVTASWKYDERGRTLSETRGIGSDTFLTQWTYNSANLPVTMTYPGNNSGGAGEVLTYDYLQQMLVNTVYSNTNSYYYVQNSQYDAGGRTEYLKLGAANLTNNPLLVVDYVYNLWTVEAGRLSYLKEGTYGSATSLEYFQYDYDAVGNVNWIKDYNAGGTQTQTFHYDGLNRLTDATASGGTGGIYALENYYYDSNTGNLSSKAGVSYTYLDTAHQHAVTHLGGVQKYWYDPNGNMTTRISGSNTYNFTYDTENHLLSVSGGTTASFVYDADGARVRGTSGGATTDYVGSYYEYTSAGSTNYYSAGSTRVAERRTGYTSNNGLFWLTVDHLGSTSVTANSSGTKTAEVRYKPWGEDRYTSGTTLTTYKYTGQRQESSFGLYYYGARWYDSSLSRFASADTVTPGGTQGLDRYQYTSNNPVNRIDPSGHLDDCGAATGANQQCVRDNLWTVDQYKFLTRNEYGVTLKNGSRDWDYLTAGVAFQGLNNTYSPLIDTHGVTFTLNNNKTPGKYGGETKGTNIDFNISPTTGLPLHNFYHEYGHSWFGHFPSGSWKTAGQLRINVCRKIQQGQDFLLDIR